MQMNIRFKDVSVKNELIMGQDENGNQVVKGIRLEAPVIEVEKPKDGKFVVTVGETQKCNTCKKEKPRDAYHKNSSNTTQLQKMCIVCKREWDKKKLEERNLKRQLREEQNK
jgi:hypothetical protein